MFQNAPKLTESGVKYFLKESLKNCRNVKYKYYSTITNILLFLGFIIVVGGFLYYKKKKKLTAEEKKAQQLEKEKFILDKIRDFQIKNKRKKKL